MSSEISTLVLLHAYQTDSVGLQLMITENEFQSSIVPGSMIKKVSGLTNLELVDHESLDKSFIQRHEHRRFQQFLKKYGNI